MGEAQPGRQPDARWIRIDFPRMYSQDGGRTRLVCPLDFLSTRCGVLMRKPHPQPIGITCPNRSATSGGTSRIGPLLVRCTCGCRGNAGDPTMRSGAMLASRRIPCAASTGQRPQRALIDRPFRRSIRRNGSAPRRPTSARGSASDRRRTPARPARTRGDANGRANRSRVPQP